MIGERLKKLRGKRTQEEVANHIGISRARYSHFENGIREPDLGLVVRLADYYGVTTDYLLGKSNDPHLTSDEYVEKLLKIMEGLPEEKKKELEKEILAYAKGYADANKRDLN